MSPAYQARPPRFPGLCSQIDGLPRTIRTAQSRDVSLGTWVLPVMRKRRHRSRLHTDVGIAQRSSSLCNEAEPLVFLAEFLACGSSNRCQIESGSQSWVLHHPRKFPTVPRLAGLQIGPHYSAHPKLYHDHVGWPWGCTWSLLSDC